MKKQREAETPGRGQKETKTKRSRRLDQEGESGPAEERGDAAGGGWEGARGRGGPGRRVGGGGAEDGKAHFAGNLLSCFWAAPPAAAARPGCLFQY